MSQIKDIVYDLGRVLLDFSYDDLFLFFSEHGVTFKRVEDFIDRSNLRAYEYGTLSSNEFIDNLTGFFCHPLDRNLL